MVKGLAACAGSAFDHRSPALGEEGAEEARAVKRLVSDSNREDILIKKGKR